MSCAHTTYSEIQGWMFEADLLHLRKRCVEAPRSLPILEIGSYRGLSTAVLSENHLVVCVDPKIGRAHV